MCNNLKVKIEQLVNDILSSGVDIRNSDCYTIAERLIELNYKKEELNND